MTTIIIVSQERSRKKKGHHHGHQLAETCVDSRDPPTAAREDARVPGDSRTASHVVHYTERECLVCFGYKQQRELLVPHFLARALCCCTPCTHTKCPCGASLDDSGTHTSPSCSKDRSLQAVRSSVLRAADQAARSQGLSAALELTSFSPLSGHSSKKRPDLATASWPAGKSLKVIDLAVANPVPPSTQYHHLPPP